MSNRQEHPRSDVRPLNDDNPYLLRSTSEILYLLRALIKRRSAISAYYNDQQAFATLSLIKVDSEKQLLIFDLSASPESNLALLQAKQIICVTNHDKVKVQFDCQHFEATRFEEREAFRVPIPDKILKLQRRNYYRLSIPYNQTLKCHIALPDQLPVEVELMDISLGGAGIIGYTPDIILEPGMFYENCSINLPGFGLVVTSLQIKNSFDFTLRSGVHTRRSGCKFLNLTQQMETLLQRYILEQERKLRSKLLEGE